MWPLQNLDPLKVEGAEDLTAEAADVAIVEVDGDRAFENVAEVVLDDAADRVLRGLAAEVARNVDARGDAADVHAARDAEPGQLLAA